MPEVGLGAALERFELVARRDVCCTVDIVDAQTASIVLPGLPEFPLEFPRRRPALDTADDPTAVEMIGGPRCASLPPWHSGFDQ